MNTLTAFETLWQKDGDRLGAIQYLVDSCEIEYKTVEGVDTKIIRLVNPNKYNELDFYTQLTQRGVAVLKIIDSGEELKSFQTEFRETIEKFPEYKEGAQSHVIGGFAAFGNPASFHNELVRKLRLRAYNRLKPHMQTINQKRFDQTQLYNFESLFDRMMFRHKGSSPTAESWHRDVMPANKIGHDDELLGGWINLDATSQYFSAVPGSHLNIRQSEIVTGFDTLSSNIERDLRQQNNFKEMPKSDQIKFINKKLREFTQQDFAHRIEVPPLHIVVFPQYIMHEVIATKSKHDMMRLFTTWRLTFSDQALHSFNKYQENIILDQAVPCLGGGMFPPMYSSNHTSYFLAKPFQVIPDKYKASLVTWSADTFNEKCLAPSKMYTSTQKEHTQGSTYQIVDRHMHSLKHYEFPLYPEYSYEEVSIHRPLPLRDLPHPTQSHLEDFVKGMYKSTVLKAELYAKLKIEYGYINEDLKKRSKVIVRSLNTYT